MIKLPLKQVTANLTIFKDSNIELAFPNDYNDLLAPFINGINEQLYLYTVRGDPYGHDTSSLIVTCSSESGPRVNIDIASKRLTLSMWLSLCNYNYTEPNVEEQYEHVEYGLERCAECSKDSLAELLKSLGDIKLDFKEVHANVLWDTDASLYIVYQILP